MTVKVGFLVCNLCDTIINMSVFAKTDALSEIARDIAQIFFASLFVGPLVTNSFNLALMLLGLTLAVIFWLVGLALIKS
jgi:hypothetical protein